MVRAAAFEFLAEHVRLYGDVLPAQLLRSGLQFRGQKVALKGIQGIFKPAILPELPLSITTSPPEPGRPRPYDDGFTSDGSVLLYRYRGTDPHHYQNAGLRRAMERRRPLIYFHGIVRGQYFATWPVYVVDDEPTALRFRVAVDDIEVLAESASSVGEGVEEARRRYITVVTRQRLHQRTFRTRVLRAYRERCALCRLRHERLLDAAHIVPDMDPRGEPVVPNGLSLCKLHHAAFDQDLIGIRPDHRIEIRRDVLEERDGPMLIHGLQGFHGLQIATPRAPDDCPDPHLLEKRYQQFLASG